MFSMIRIVSLYYFFHWSNVQWFCKLISILILFGSLWRFRHGKRYFEAWFFLLYFFLLWNLLLWLFLILTCQLCKLKLRCSYGFSINKAGLLWSKEGTGWGRDEYFVLDFFPKMMQVLFLIILSGGKLISMSDIKCNFLIGKKKIKLGDKEQGRGISFVPVLTDKMISPWEKYGLQEFL